MALGEKKIRSLPRNVKTHLNFRLWRKSSRKAVQIVLIERSILNLFALWPSVHFVLIVGKVFWIICCKFAECQEGLHTSAVRRRMTEYAQKGLLAVISEGNEGMFVWSQTFFISRPIALFRVPSANGLSLSLSLFVTRSQLSLMFKSAISSPKFNFMPFIKRLRTEMTCLFKY